MNRPMVSGFIQAQGALAVSFTQRSNSFEAPAVISPSLTFAVVSLAAAANSSPVA